MDLPSQCGRPIRLELWGLFFWNGAREGGEKEERRGREGGGEGETNHDLFKEVPVFDHPIGTNW